MLNGWTVLRFSWEDVMHDAEWVRSVSHIAASAAMFITVVNTIVAGGVVVFLLWPTGVWPSALAGVLVGLAHFAVWMWLGWRNWQLNIAPEWTRFPVTPDA